MALKLVCFDIDDTILNGHLFNALAMDGQTPGTVDEDTIRWHLNLIGGVKNAKALKQTMHDLLEAGVQVALTSFTNYQETIDPILEMIGLSAEDKAKIHRVCFTPPREVQDAQGKTEHLRQAMAAAGLSDASPAEVLLVDDYDRNIRLATEAGFQGIEVHEREGSTGYLSELRKRAGLSGLPPVGEFKPPPRDDGFRWVR